MRKILPLAEANYFKASRKKALRLIGTASLFASLIVAAVFFHTSTGAVIPEAFVPRAEVSIARQHVRFTLYPEGIYPPKATLRAGAVSIGIEDMAGTDGGVLVERLTGGQRTVVGSVQRLQQHFRGRASVDLSPGTYRLRIAGRQANEAELIVEP